jgi:hypothetical protein
MCLTTAALDPTAQQLEDDALANAYIPRHAANGLPAPIKISFHFLSGFYVPHLRPFQCYYVQRYSHYITQVWNLSTPFVEVFFWKSLLWITRFLLPHFPSFTRRQEIMNIHENQLIIERGESWKFPAFNSPLSSERWE